MPSSACDWSSDVCSSDRSEEHTSELQSRSDLVCRLLLEKKKKNYNMSLRSQEQPYESHSRTSLEYDLDHPTNRTHLVSVVYNNKSQAAARSLTSATCKN